MKKVLFVFIAVLVYTSYVSAQNANSDEIGIGLRFQKTEQLYWENGIGIDYSSDALFGRHIHLKMSYATSGLGSAMSENAIVQDNFLVGFDWRFRPKKAFQIFTGLNTGYFYADYGPGFEALPHSSLMFSAEAGLFYRFKFPAAASLSAGYNFINGNGIDVPGTLFPVFYQLSIYYYLGKK